ncbi:hypothetical protein Gohar_020654 [Gossypium harknessii]|uniref:Ferritin n=1 Tax=Gossypium harknessii TaxID=34285 RepID=A0A7J9I136_9ROSI|nr:hypothetical protein [Gossypium harknessii]
MFLSSVSCSRPLWGFPALSSAPSFFPQRKHHGRASGISASLETENLALTGVVFQPFEELKKEDFDIPVTPQVSLARQKYTDDCEAAINEQINVEYSVSYVYHSLYAYFDRDNIALKGLTKLSRNLMKEKRENAEKLMETWTVELALSLEKLINEKLPSLHNVILLNLMTCIQNPENRVLLAALPVAEQNNDPQVADFIESEFLSEHVEAIKKISEYVAQLRLVGKGHGVWHFDQMLLHEGGAA